LPEAIECCKQQYKRYTKSFHCFLVD
jgi:hypothetical protein